MPDAVRASRSTLAESADRHRLYECAVQNPRLEVDFIDRTYRQLRGRSARWLGENFCGTAAVCCEWFRRRKTNRALGVDLDPVVLDWGRCHYLAALPASQRARIELLEQDVATAASRPLNLVLAMNFSYWLLAGRATLRTYFVRVRAALALDGVFLLDSYGGYDAYRRIIEERSVENPELGRFVYQWEQALYDPISGRLVCHIHFNFAEFQLCRRFSPGACLHLRRLAIVVAAGDPGTAGRSGILPGAGLLAGLGPGRSLPAGRDRRAGRRVDRLSVGGALKAAACQDEVRDGHCRVQR